MATASTPGSHRVTPPVPPTRTHSAGAASGGSSSSSSSKKPNLRVAIPGVDMSPYPGSLGLPPLVGRPPALPAAVPTAYLQLRAPLPLEPAALAMMAAPPAGVTGAAAAMMTLSHQPSPRSAGSAGSSTTVPTGTSTDALDPLAKGKGTT
jgi:hypothetical protein